MKHEELTDDAIDYILANLEDTMRMGPQHGELNDWERGFVESVSDQWERSRSLSEKQKEILGKIWDKQP
jgi:hypothetical protein